MSNTSGSTTVDQRIVEMRIDNEKFEAGAKKTIGILESLDRSLKGLGQENADGFDKIGNSLDKVTDRFSAMGIIGDQVMRNLTNKAMEFVGQFKNVTTMLTTQQIDAGWNKYADKTQAIQTIMAATSGKIEDGFFANQAEQLEWVNEQIEKLNKFTDETSYNFLDMVGNIGKFTAAGRELEESVVAMEGIANWAAISGGRPAEASRAMYNLSQALGLGAVTVQDWKSIENANMATYEFKQQVIDTAEELGTLRKVAEGTWEVVNPTTNNADVEVTVENFRGALAQKWFNSDVLLTVLNRYGEFSDELLKVTENIDLTVTDYLKLLKAFKSGDAAFTEAIEHFSLTDDEVKELLPDLQRLSAEEYELGFRAFQAAQEAKTFTEAIDATKDAVSTKWMTVFELLFGNYLEAKELWTQMAEVFWDIFASPVDHLIDIIKGAGGFFGEEGFVGEFSDNLGKAAGSTAVLEDRLTAVGKTMKDFRKALEKTLGPNEARKIIDAYGTLDEALLKGGISAEQFKKALGELDDTFENTKTVSLNRALNKAGMTMTDFEKAIEQVGDQAALDLIENFGGIEEALERGGISIDLFKKALESLGIDSENVSENIEENAISAVGSIEEMRELALEVLRGDHGNGDERLAWYESMGLDPELMQAMVGNLKNIPRAALDDDYLMELMESYYQAQHLSARLGYETFAEYLASCTGAAQDFVYDMNTMADEADDIYASLFGEGVLNAAGEYYSAGELFRMSLSNLLDALDKFGTAFDKAFMKVFGGANKYDDQVANLSNGFFTLTAAFYSFSEKVLAFSESDTFLNFMTAFFSITRLIGKAIGIVFKVGKAGLSLALKLLSPVLRLLTGLFEIISTGLDTVSRTLEDLDIFGLIDAFGDSLLNKISEPIDKIIKVIDKLIEAFKEGFAEGGIESGLRNMYDTFQVLLQNHPVILAAVNILGKAFLFLKNVIEGLVLAFGGIIGGAVMGVIAVFKKLGEWFGKFLIWAQNSELINAIWEKITSTFKKIANVIKRVYGYAEKGYKEGGFAGAFQAVVDSFERGVTRLVPGGEKLIELFDTVKNAIRGLFTKKIVNENGVEELVDQTDGAILRLEESVNKFGSITDVLRDGAVGDGEQQAGFRDRIKQLVSNLWEGFLEALRDIRVGDVINALRLGVIADIVLKVGHGLNIFNQLGENIREIPENLSWTIENISLMFKSLAIDFKANAVIKFAVAAGIVAGAIWILSNIPDAQLEKASSVVISILSVLSLLALALGKTSASIFQTIQYMPALGAALIGFAMLVSSIGTTALTLALIAKFVGINELSTAAATVGTILAIIGAMIVSIILLVKHSKFNMEQMKALSSVFKSIGLSMIGIALAVQMMMIPILAFSAVLKFARGSAGIKKFWSAVGAVGAIMAAIALLVWVIMASVNGYTAEQISQLGNFMIKIAAAMVIIAFGISMLTTPILILAAAQKILGLNIKGIVTAIAVLGIIGGLIALLLVVFGGVMANKETANIKAVGSMLLKFAASMVLIALALAVMTVPIIKIAELCKKMESVQVWKSLGFLLVTIGLLAGILALLSAVVLKGKGGANSLGLGKGLMRIAEGILLLAIAALVLTPAIIVLAAAIAYFTNALGNMTDEQWETFEKGLERLGKFSKKLALFGAALLIVGLAATLTGTGIIAMSLSILLFAAAIAVIILALPKLVEAFQKLEEIDPKKLNFSVGKLMVMIGALTIGLVAFAYVVSRIFHLLGGGALSRIGEGFLETISSIARGMRTGIKNGFTSVIEYLKDENNKKQILAILESLILVGAAYVAGILPTVAHVVIGGIVGLLNAISAEISAQAPEIVEALHNIVSALVKVAASLIDKITGKDFLTKLLADEESLNRVTGAVEGLGLAFGALKLVKPFRLLKNFLDNKKGGLLSSITNVSTVSSQVDEAMIALSGSSSGYFTSLLPTLGIVGGAILAIAAAVAYANSNLNQQQDILEERSYGGAAHNLETNAAAIEDTEKRIAQLKQSMDDGATEYSLVQEHDALVLLLKTLKEEREELEKQADVTEKVTSAVSEGSSKLGSASAQEEKFANKTKETNKELKETAVEVKETTAAVSESTGSFEKLTETVNSLGLGNMLSGIGLDLNSFMENLKGAFGDQGFNINDFLKSDGTGFDTEKITSLINVEQLKTDLKTRLSTASGAIPEGVKEGITDNAQQLVDGAGSMKDTLVTSFLSGLGINCPSRVLADEAGAIPEGVALGMQENQSYVTGGIINMLYHMLKTFDGYHNMFVSSGASIVQGMIDGIQNNLQVALIAGENLGTTVMNGFRSKLDIHSPSRVFMSLARYIPEGVAQGIADNEDVAITEIVGFGSELIDVITSAMAQAAYVASDNFSITPTITPVVDVSNAKMAAGSVSSMFNKSYGSYVDSITARAGDVSQTVDYNLQNKEMVSEVRALSQRLDQLGQSITNMQIVLDSGVMVGAMTPQLDMQLGKMAVRKGRGN